MASSMAMNASAPCPSVPGWTEDTFLWIQSNGVLTSTFGLLLILQVYRGVAAYCAKASNWSLVTMLAGLTVSVARLAHFSLPMSEAFSLVPGEFTVILGCFCMCVHDAVVVSFATAVLTRDRRDAGAATSHRAATGSLFMGGACLLVALVTTALESGWSTARQNSVLVESLTVGAIVLGQLIIGVTMICHALYVAHHRNNSEHIMRKFAQVELMLGIGGVIRASVVAILVAVAQTAGAVAFQFLNTEWAAMVYLLADFWPLWCTMVLLWKEPLPRQHADKSDELPHTTSPLIADAADDVTSQPSSRFFTSLDDHVLHHNATYLFCGVVLILMLELALYGGHMSCYSPAAQLGIGVFLARAGAVPFYLLVPLTFVVVFKGTLTHLENTLFGQVMPRMKGSLLPWHIMLSVLWIVLAAVHIAGHFILWLSAKRMISDDTLHLPASSPLYSYAHNALTPLMGMWLLPWVTGALIILCFVLLVLAYACFKGVSRRFADFLSVHRAFACAILILAGCHGAAGMFGPPRLWISCVVVIAAYTFDKLWMRRSTRILDAVHTAAFVEVDGRHEKTVVVRFKCPEFAHQLVQFGNGFVYLQLRNGGGSGLHPFSPVWVDSEHIEFHIRVHTGWTLDLYNVVTAHVASSAVFQHYRIRSTDADGVLMSAAAVASSGAITEQTAALLGDFVPSKVRMGLTGVFRASLCVSKWRDCASVVLVGLGVGVAPLLNQLSLLSCLVANQSGVGIRNVFLFFRGGREYSKYMVRFVANLAASCPGIDIRIGLSVPAAVPISTESVRVQFLTYDRAAFWNAVAAAGRSAAAHGTLATLYCGNVEGLKSFVDCTKQSRPTVRLHEAFG